MKKNELEFSSLDKNNNKIVYSPITFAPRSVSHDINGSTFSTDDIVVEKKQVHKHEISRLALGYKNSSIKSLWSRIKVPIILGWCRIWRTVRPVVVVLTVNNNCNWNCTYCYGSYPQQGTDKNLSTEQLTKLIDDFAAMGCCYMLVHGGEALLRKDIGYIIDYIKTKGIYVCLVTNGQLFPRRIEELRNVDNITVSLDGSPRNNDLNRGEGTHNYALTAIKLALAEGFKVRVSCTLSQNNKDDIHYLAELAKSLGVPVSFSILFKTDFTKPDEDFLALNPDEIRHCIRTIKQLKHKGFPLFTSNLNLDYALSWPYERFNKLYLMKDQVPSNFKHMRCHYGTLKFHLEGDGRVMPCTILSANSFESKSVLKVSTREALQHVHETNKCVACPHLSQNEWNLLMGMNFKTIIYNIIEQVKEIKRWY